MSDKNQIKSWIRVNRKMYNLENATTVEVSMGDVIVTFPGYEIAQAYYDNDKEVVVEKIIPIQLSIDSEDGKRILNWLSTRTVDLNGKRTIMVSGNIQQQNG